LTCVALYTRSQAVARIADRTASQQSRYSAIVARQYLQLFSRYCALSALGLTFRCHVTSSITWAFDSPWVISYWWSVGTKPFSLTVSEIFNVERNAMADMTLIRPLNKGQGHSFWYQSISHTTSYRLSI